MKMLDMNPVILLDHLDLIGCVLDMLQSCTVKETYSKQILAFAEKLQRRAKQCPVDQSLKPKEYPRAEDCQQGGRIFQLCQGKEELIRVQFGVEARKAVAYQKSIRGKQLSLLQPLLELVASRFGFAKEQTITQKGAKKLASSIKKAKIQQNVQNGKELSKTRTFLPRCWRSVPGER